MADLNSVLEQNTNTTPNLPLGENTVATKHELLSKLSSLKNQPTISPLPVNKITLEPTQLPEFTPQVVQPETSIRPVESQPQSPVTEAQPTTPIQPKTEVVELKPETVLNPIIETPQKPVPFKPEKILKKGSIGVQNIFNLQEELNNKRNLAN